MDLVNKALEQAKAFQQTAVDATKKRYDRAQPLVREGIARALEAGADAAVSAARSLRRPPRRP